MPKCLTFSLDVDYPAVGRLIEDLRHREGILAINLVDDRRALTTTEHDPMPKKHRRKKPTQPFSAAVLQTLYTRGAQTKDTLREMLPEYVDRTNAHFSQTLSYMRTTGRTAYFEKSNMWDLTKSYRAHVDKRLGGGAALTDANDAIALPRPVSNGHARNGHIKSKQSGGELIMKLLMAKQAPLHRNDFKIAFAKDGRSKTSIGDQLFKLVKAHKIRRVEKGTYELIA